MFAFAKILSHLHNLLVAPVEHTLVTMVALGSFSAALILLPPSMIIFSSDFAAKHFFACVS